MTVDRKESLRDVANVSGVDEDCEAMIADDDQQGADGAAAVMEVDQKLQLLEIRAKAANKKGVELLLEIKEILAEAHALLAKAGRGSRFGAWVKEHFPDLSERTSERYLQVHRAFKGEEAASLMKFDVTALYLLSEDKVTNTSRAMALMIAKGGGRITTEAARHFATNPWDLEAAAPPPPSPPPTKRSPAPLTIAIDGGKVIVRLQSDDGSVEKALAQAIKRFKAKPIELT